MNDNDRIDKLEHRVDRLETSIEAKLNAIFEKLNTLAVDTVRNACPAPGSCVKLGGDMEYLLKSHNATMLRVERLELQLISINQQKAWILGAWSVVAIIAAAIGSLGGIVLSNYMPHK